MRVGAVTSSASVDMATPVHAVVTSSTRVAAILVSTTVNAVHGNVDVWAAVSAADEDVVVVDVGNILVTDGDLTGVYVRTASGEHTVRLVQGRVRPIRVSEAASARKLSAAKDTLVSVFVSVTLCIRSLHLTNVSPFPVAVICCVHARRVLVKILHVYVYG